MATLLFLLIFAGCLEACTANTTSSGSNALACSAGNFTAGDNATITCYFPTDINATMHHVYVTWYPFNTTDVYKDVITCFRRRNGLLICDVLDGFKYNNIISDTLIFEIPAVTPDFAGRYSCLLVPPWGTPPYLCTLHVKNTTRYTPKPTTTTTSTTTTASPLSPCENLRDAKHLLGNYVPRCTEKGDYDSLQCRGHPGTGTCWCADLSGREIPGTARDPPKTPNCDTGTNLPPCVFRLVQQSRSGLLGAFRPKCTLEGDFEKEQCSGSMCYCADSKSGVKIPNTEVFKPDRPNCSVGVGVEREDEKEEKPPVSNETGGSGPMKDPSSTAHDMGSGIVAVIIGGSAVMLLCAILLVVFIVFCMRKKDEGSYVLDEPKKMPNYSYQRAPDKEFYA